MNKRNIPTRGIAQPTASQPTASRRPWLLTTLIAAIFLSAALLFAVQPMFTKMVLPRLGGSPSVWSVAMVFFQAMLLAGYGYAHLLTRFAPGGRSILIHLVVMLLACSALPLSIADGWGSTPASFEALWLLALFTVSIGLPFFALSANGPLLQAWFARTDHPSAKDPYFLYAASNVGSFLALIAYPLAIEPLIPLSNQTQLWSYGFVLLIVLIGACGFQLWDIPSPPSLTERADGTEAAPPTWHDAAAWVGLAAVPSGLLVAVTAHISTDIAAVPLLWAVPLSLYLLTFVIVFQRRRLIRHDWIVLAQPVFIIGLLAVLLYEPISQIVGVIAIHIGVFFVCALVCHGELAKRRPPARYLTSFYLWMSAGGMIGGIAAGLVAPNVFSWVAEYPILIACAVLCRPGLGLPKSRIEQAIFFGAIAVAIIALATVKLLNLDIDEKLFNWITGGLLLVTVLFWRDPLPFAAIVAFVLFANHFVFNSDLKTVRSFFGIHRISESGDGRYRLLNNGTTLHGGQRIRDDDGNPVTGRPDPLMYYYDGSALAQVLDAARARAGRPINYAVIGLGTGSLACRAAPGDKVHYYEIDRTIISIARDPSNFSFISECQPNLPITLGDARLTLAEAPDESYDVIIVDAFTSDAIPIHLLTSEAMDTYMQKLAPHGIVAVHVSNRHLELASVVVGIADANGMVARVSESGDVKDNDDEYIFLATVVVAAREDEDFGELANSQYWEQREPDPDQSVWTDNYSNIVGAIIRQYYQ